MRAHSLPEHGTSNTLVSAEDERMKHECKLCGQPMLPPGERRKDPDDYRHASGCPKDMRAWRCKHPLAWRWTVSPTIDNVNPHITYPHLKTGVAVVRLNSRGDPSSHAPVAGVEWCAKCGAFRMIGYFKRDRDPWTLPGGDE